MHTIMQLQALEFWLKKVTVSSIYKSFNGKNLRFIIEKDGKLWSGSAIIFTDGAPSQEEINDYNETVLAKYHSSGSGASQFFKNLNNRFNHYFAIDVRKPAKNFLVDVTDVSHLFHLLMDLRNNLDWKEYKSPLRPYLYDVTSLSDNFKVPFIDLGDQEFRIVSLTDEDVHSAS